MLDETDPFLSWGTRHSAVLSTQLCCPSSEQHRNKPARALSLSARLTVRVAFLTALEAVCRISAALPGFRRLFVNLRVDSAAISSSVHSGLKSAVCATNNAESESFLLSADCRCASLCSLSAPLRRGGQGSVYSALTQISADVDHVPAANRFKTIPKQ